MKPDRLYGGYIDVKPRFYLYSASTHADYGDGDTDTEWESWQTVECEQCGEVFVLTSGGGEPHNELDPDSECEGYVPLAEGPMINYFYPLDIGFGDGYSEEEAVRSIAHLPLCVVRVDGEWGLALTGGGMDLSWEICEAYMCLGYLPPVHFCSLPAMSGRGTSERDRWILSGCIRACEVMRHRMVRREADLRRLMGGE